MNAGVKRVYGVVGDSLNGLTEIICKTKGIDWLYTRHEEAAAFAAGAEAHLGRDRAGSCGPGNLRLINGLFVAKARQSQHVGCLELKINGQLDRARSANLVERIEAAVRATGSQTARQRLR